MCCGSRRAGAEVTWERASDGLGHSKYSINLFFSSSVIYGICACKHSIFCMVVTARMSLCQILKCSRFHLSGFLNELERPKKHKERPRF